MLDKAAVPELTGAMESIATHRQCFEGQGCVPYWAGGGTHTHIHTHTKPQTHRHRRTRSISQPYTLHPKGRTVQRRAANPTSTSTTGPGAAEFTCPTIQSLFEWNKRTHVR